MNRRNGTGPKLIGVAVVIVIFIYGLYSYNDIQSKLRTAEEKTERLRQQYDSLSAQLQVVYEHKSRLEKSLQTEKSDHKKTRDDLIARKSEADAKFATQKQELMNRVSTLNQEYKMLQSQHEDLQADNTKLQESLNKLQDDHKQQLEQHNLEFRQMQQDKENDIAKLRDELANLDRRYKVDLGKLQGQNQQVASQDLLVTRQQLQQEFREKNNLQGELKKARQENDLLARQQLQNKQAVDQNQQAWLDKSQHQKLQPNLQQGLLHNSNLNDNSNINANLNQLPALKGGAINSKEHVPAAVANPGGIAQNQPFQNNLVDNAINPQGGGLAAGLNQPLLDQNKLRNDIAPANPAAPDSVNMQIALPGQDKHPGYHEVKDVDPADQLHHQKELAAVKGENVDNLPENKGPIVMQQPAPNLQAKFGDGVQPDQFGAGPNGLDFQAPAQPDLKDHNFDTFRNDKIRNHPEILGAGGINQPDPDLGRIRAPVANDNQIPLPGNEGLARDNEDDDEDDGDKYDDGNDEGQQQQQQQGQVLPPNLGRNEDALGGQGVLDDPQQNQQQQLHQQEENQVPVPNNNNDQQHDLLAQGQAVGDRHGDYDKAQPVPQGGDDNEGDYQEDEDEDNRGRLAAGRDFQK